RFGVMRAREFIRKDAYSFHTSEESLQQTYDKMHAAYTAIFNRLGLDFRPVLADTGSIGGAKSHEFHVLASSGEDDIAFSTDSDHAANVEVAEAVAPAGERPAATAVLTTVSASAATSIDHVAAFFKVDASKVVKAIVVRGAHTDEKGEGEPGQVVLFLRGDHELNEIKAEKIPGVA